MRSFAGVLLVSCLTVDPLWAFHVPAQKTKPTHASERNLAPSTAWLADLGEAMTGSLSLNVEGIDTSILQGNEALIGGAVAALGAAAFLATNQLQNDSESSSDTSDPEPEPEPIDVSIPYNAAAVVAYASLFGEDPDTSSTSFTDFERLYLEQAVAEVTFKAKKREMVRLVNAK